MESSSAMSLGNPESINADFMVSAEGVGRLWKEIEEDSNLEYSFRSFTYLPFSSNVRSIISMILIWAAVLVFSAHFFMTLNWNCDLRFDPKITRFMGSGLWIKRL